MFTTQDEWDRGYTQGRRYRALTDTERSLLATHLPPAAGGRALEVGCGTGELAAHLSSSGYAVDAIDWSETALAEAGTRHGDAARWLRLDVEGDDGASLNADGYDLITLRFVAPFLSSRDRTLDALGRRLRPGGALVLITPLAADTPAERRGIALDEDELARLQNRWATAQRHDGDGLVFLILRGPRQDEAAPHVAAQRTPSSARHGESAPARASLPPLGAPLPAGGVGTQDDRGPRRHPREGGHRSRGRHRLPRPGQRPGTRHHREAGHHVRLVR
ncbi:class I SAM-dependent methyltransferase [Streptomyces mirabilis]|uniref:class I SAM-dependent methyltransferase n=1 Tax=Streptomyces mirabilis TaxID=68239 RepID=UPI0036BA1765